MSRCSVADSSQYQPLLEAGKTSARVPVGHVPVFVGDEMELFAVRAELLGRPAFVDLLRLSAMEYGYEQVGVLRIPCTVQLFRRLLLAADSDSGDDLAADELGRCLQERDRSCLSC
ncbi:hypothetical protein HPP92_005581 [Vanilla planifolia]|uniref:Small auxin up regulated protein n=1 Tax=Vanilla planifolia TaxID=51239 RepID=A0A835VBF3_VANPL|nr:hypothetical protein HPP92_005930 [Vanilla planifolia]KAG0494587.1 hypothetical protein HPP92_005581 [Vanilla planifolia]